MILISIVSYNADAAGFEYDKRAYRVSDAKREMKRLIENGYDDCAAVKYKVYSSGEWVNCGNIELSGRNAHFIANSRQKSNGYA